MLGSALAGILAWRTARAISAGPPIDGRLALGFGVLVAAVATQLIPLPPWVVEAISPQSRWVVNQRDLIYAASPGWLPLSIEPHATGHALALLVAFGLLSGGLARYLTATGTRWLVWSVTGLGVVLALIGVIQKATFTGQIYGFWTTQMGGSPFGPFVNRNHFAGWMLMALPMTLALLCAALTRGMAGVRPTLRDRLIWFGSRPASEMLLLTAAAAIMAVSVVLTSSRSGMVAVLGVVLVLAGLAARGLRSTTGRIVSGVLLVGLVVGAAQWAGPERIADRFEDLDGGEWRQRPEAWADAWDIARMFPLTGTGLNTYGVATLFFQKRQLAAHYAQAHNDYLQLLAEGGALLAIPSALLLVFFVREVRRRFRDADGERGSSWWARAGAVTGLVAIGLQEVVDFSLQMPANGALFAVLCAVALHHAPVRRRPASRQQSGPAQPESPVPRRRSMTRR